MYKFFSVATKGGSFSVSVMQKLQLANVFFACFSTSEIFALKLASPIGVGFCAYLCTFGLEKTLTCAGAQIEKAGTFSKLAWMTLLTLMIACQAIAVPLLGTGTTWLACGSVVFAVSTVVQDLAEAGLRKVFSKPAAPAAV